MLQKTMLLAVFIPKKMAFAVLRVQEWFENMVAMVWG